MAAALKTLFIGVIVVQLGGFGPLRSATASSPAHPRLQISRAPAAPTCQAANLAIAPDLSSGATGHIGIELRLHNASTHPCTLKGFATIVLLDGSRSPLLTVLHWGPGGFFNFNRPVRLVTLAPGGNAYLAMGWAHIPTTGQTCPLAPNLLVLPPGASSAVLISMGHASAHNYGPVDACGGQLSVSAVEPTPFML
ncbi:MAG TPA: DUF4232 domain-containing protein [Chloroflexota bacterium]|nr:DUF4232 domain-containing protein [Chloroflexota bacterium]